MSKIQIQTKNKRFPVAPDLYGAFFEDISRAGDGGIYPEMLRNRSFEDSIIPDDCVSHDGGRTFVSPTGWVDEFNNGEGMNDWVEKNHIVPTPYPAWYSENAEMVLDEQDTLNAIRRVSMKVDFSEGGSIRNIGVAGVPQEEGRSYRFMCFAKAEKEMPLRLLVKEGDRVFSEASFTVDSADWKQYEVTLTASGTTGTAAFYIISETAGEVKFGFTTLMPTDTYLGHGLRKDLVEKLRDMHPGFLRFPGGCIVEGFSMETAMYFRKTIGPIWERPSFWLLWHYRSTNGLGFHEYLQLAEDIGAEPMYVCNCGMTCQGRKPYYFSQSELEDICQDTMNALEYALGAPNSKWGSLRAAAGHPEPFKLKYLEIGNENWGEEYFWRYEYVRKRVMEKYPDLLIVANTRDEVLKADIVDDHYYNMPEFYAENIGIYDHYDRTRPDVFIGEFSVNQSYEGQLRGAVSEAMFMIGFERNQDKVKLCAYAPLFEHVHYYSWYPNLIIFDNYRSYVIPSYYVFRVFSKNRGQYVVESQEEMPVVYRKLNGLPVVVGNEGAMFKNPVWNGKTTGIDKHIRGSVEAVDDAFVIREDPLEEERARKRLLKTGYVTTFGDAAEVDNREGTFEADILFEDKMAGIGVLCGPKPLSFYDRNLPVPTDPWVIFNMEPIVLHIENGKATVLRGLDRQILTLADNIDVPKADGKYHHVKCEYDLRKAVFSIDGEVIADIDLPSYPGLCSVVTDTDEEVFVKIVNFEETEEEVEISLDVDVMSDYSVDRFHGNSEDENTIDEPDVIKDETVAMTGAGRTFIYKAPGMSVNVIKLKKK